MSRAAMALVASPAVWGLVVVLLDGCGANARTPEAVGKAAPGSTQQPQTPAPAASAAPAVPISPTALGSRELDEVRRIFATGEPTMARTNAPPSCVASRAPRWHPSRVWLLHARREGTRITVQGEALHVGDVADVACAFSASDLFADVTLHSMEQPGTTRTFELQAVAPSANASTEELSLDPPSHPEPPDGAAPARSPTALPLERLRLVGVVLRDDPVAMLAAPDGLGVILHVGDVVPREAGGTWRVQRIAATQVDFVAADGGPSTPKTRSMSWAQTRSTP